MDSIPTVGFVPGRPAPWEDFLENDSDPAVDRTSVTFGLTDLLDGYRHILYFGRDRLRREFKDGYCEVGVSALEARFGVRLLGYLKAIRERRLLRIQLDDFTKARLIAHWARNTPKEFRSREKLIQRADLMADLGVENLLQAIVESLELPASGPGIFHQAILEGMPPLPSALLMRRYARHHSQACQRLDRIRYNIAARALLLLHPELLSRARVSMRVHVEPLDLDESWP